MNPDLPFWLKLWNKGVDISAAIIGTTISAGIVALIATLTWGLKRKRDLKLEEDKQRQHDKMAEDSVRKKYRIEESERIPRLERELEAIVEGITIAGQSASSAQCTAAWDAYVKWLAKNNLEYIPHNKRLLNEWADVSGSGQLQKAKAWADQWSGKVKATKFKDDM